MARYPRGSAGRPRSGSPADAVHDDDPLATARSICLRQLAMGPRTRAQLATVMARKGVEEDTATQALDRLENVGLIDDAAYAEVWVRSRHRDRGLAKRALSMELRQRGVADELVLEALEVIGPEDERVRARSLIDRKLSATRGLAMDVRVRRLTGLLARKGYGPGVAMAVVREALRDEVSDVHDARILDDLDGPMSDAVRDGLG